MAVYRGIFEGMNNMLPTAGSQVIEACGKLVFGLLFAYLVLRYAKKRFLHGLTVFGKKAETLSDALSAAMPMAAAAVLLGIALSTLFGLILLLLCRRRYPMTQTGKTSSGKLLRELLLAAFPITISTVMMQLIPLIDTATIFRELTAYFAAHPSLAKQMLSVLHAGENAETFHFGIFSACVTLFNLIPTIAGLLSKTALPAVSRICAAGDREKTTEYIRSVLTSGMFVTVPAALGMAAIAKLLLRVLYTRQPYTALFGERTLAVLGLAAVCSGILFPLSAILQAGKRFWSPVLCQAAGAVVKLLCNLILIRRFGIVGVTAATGISYLVMTILMLAAAGKVYGRIFPTVSGVKILILSMLSAAGAYGMQIFCRQSTRIYPSGTLHLIISMLTAVIIYLVGTFLCRPMSKKAINLLSGKEKS